MADAPELAPCPFCGGEAGSCPDPNHSTGWDIGCFNGACEIEPHVWAVHRSTAEMQWNTRATPPASVVAAMERALQAFIAETVSYMTLNQLGDPEKQHTVKTGRAALADLEAWRAGK